MSRIELQRGNLVYLDRAYYLKGKLAQLNYHLTNIDTTVDRRWYLLMIKKRTVVREAIQRFEYSKL